MTLLYPDRSADQCEARARPPNDKLFCGANTLLIRAPKSTHEGFVFYQPGRRTRASQCVGESYPFPESFCDAQTGHFGCGHARDTKRVERTIDMAIDREKELTELRRLEDGSTGMTGTHTHGSILGGLAASTTRTKSCPANQPHNTQSIGFVFGEVG